MNNFIKKNLLELKILKIIFQISTLILSISIIFILLNLKIAPIEMASISIEFLIIIYILIASLTGSYSVKDLLSKNQLSLISTYKVNLKTLILSRLVKAIIIYITLSFLSSIFLFFIFRNNEILGFITFKIIFIKLLVEGFPTLLLSLIISIFLNNSLLGFILVSTICTSLVSIWETLFNLALINKFLNLFNIYIHYNDLLETQNIGLNFILKSIIFSCIFIIILIKIQDIKPLDQNL